MILTTLTQCFCRLFHVPHSVAEGEGRSTADPTEMKAKVYVTLKPSVLDPQGKAIKHSIGLLGYNGVSDIRQGKYFEILIEGQQTAEQARTETMRMAHDVLSNPIIEDFRVEIEE